MCVCVVCVQVFLRETIEERRESCARQLEVEEEEAALREGGANNWHQSLVDPWR